MDISAYGSLPSNGLCTDYSKRKEWIEKTYPLVPDEVTQKKSGAIAPVRHNFFVFIIYPFSNPMHYVALQFIKDCNWDYIYILHDRDIDFDKTNAELLKQKELALNQGFSQDYVDNLTVDPIYKDKHYHVMIRTKDSCTNSAILKWLSYFQPWIEKGSLFVTSVSSVVTYFVHRTPDAIAEGKARYELEELVYSTHMGDIKAVKDVLSDIRSGSCNYVDDLISAINTLADNFYEPNDVLSALARTPYGKYIRSDWHMTNTLVNNALKRSKDIRASARATKDIYARSFENYCSVCRRIFIVEFAEYSKRWFTCMEMDSIMNRYNCSISSRSTFAADLSAIFGNILIDYINPQIEDLDHLCTRLDSITANFLKAIKECDNYLRSEISSPRGKYNKDLYAHISNLLHTCINNLY